MYKAVIGLEVHCELDTKTKVFSKSNNSYTTYPNTNISVIDLGYPGTLPTLNKKAVEKALQTALVLNCEIPQYLKFDRKNYFYPDLPKGYQITQNNCPVGTNGYLMINVDDLDKKILIHDIHLEEDSAGLEHLDNKTLIDYNRAGVPLIEIVTEPCLNSAKEAVACLEALRNMLIYCDLSEARADRGQIRCDVNISLMKETDTVLGTRVEIKNVNSFVNVKNVIDIEIKRQEEILKNNGTIFQETRRYDDLNKNTIRMREKVEAIDYKYFPEPNIPVIKLDNDYIKQLKDNLPILPYERKEKYLSLGITKVDANILSREKDISEYFNILLESNIDPKVLSNWMISIVISYLNKTYEKISNISLKPNMLINIIQLVLDNKISNKQGKELLNKALEEKIDPIEIYNNSNVTQITDDKYLREIIINLINKNMNLVNDYKNGKNTFNFLIGQVMKETKNQANPKLVSDILKEEMDKK